MYSISHIFTFARAIINFLTITAQFELHTYDISFVDEGSPLPNLGSKTELCKLSAPNWIVKKKKKKDI